MGPRMRISLVFDFFVDFAQTALNKVLGATVDFNGFWELSQNLNLEGTVDFQDLSGCAASSDRAVASAIRFWMSSFRQRVCGFPSCLIFLLILHKRH